MVKKVHYSILPNISFKETNKSVGDNKRIPKKPTVSISKKLSMYLFIIYLLSFYS